MLQPLLLFQKKQYRHISITSSQAAFNAQVASSVKIFENNSETEIVKDKSTPIQKEIDLIKQIEELIERYRAN